jgi:excisionase family DNA binding protein
MREEPDWIRTPEAARYLGVHVETMRRWAREGAILAAKLGNRGGFRFRREDLDRFLESRRRGSGEGAEPTD